MTLFELLFIVLFLTALVTVVRIGIHVVRGQSGRAKGLLSRLFWGLALYFTILAVVSLVTPRRYMAIGEAQCADDWCITVMGGGPDSLVRGRYVVEFQLASRARAVTQRERFVVAYLRDSAGHRYDSELEPGEVPFDTALAPLASVTSLRRFRVPERVGGLGVVIAREGGFDFPQCCIIGDDGSALHKRTVIRLPFDKSSG